MPVTNENLTDVFTYHAPTAKQIGDLQEVREAGKQLAQAILHCTPSSGDQQAALRKVREAVMTANAAIILEGQV